MSASLCIEVTAKKDEQAQSINFFEASDWTIDSEKELLTKLQDVLAAIRKYGQSFTVHINIHASEINETIFMIKKQVKKEIEINNHKLSIREIEILGLIMQGLTNQEIAKKLFISYETVRSHRKNILEKTGAKNTASLIHHYHQTFFDK